MPWKVTLGGQIGFYYRDYPKNPKQSPPDVIVAAAINGGLMAERFGQLFYRTACGIAALITVFLISAPEIDRSSALMMMGAGSVIWLIGRASRYLIAGR